MREFNRRRVAAARSRRATPEDLREASQRYKEIQEELLQLNLAPETTRGEDRLDRYERGLRLRALREEFQASAENAVPQPRNSVLLALVMTVGSFLMCAFCAGGTYYGLQYLNQTPSPTATADQFWSSMAAADYTTVHDSYLSPTLSVGQSADQFSKVAAQADTQYGKVTSATLSQQDTSAKTVAKLTYTVVRTLPGGKTLRYAVTLTLVLRQSSWTISDYGTLLTPSTTSARRARPVAAIGRYGRVLASGGV
jgi:NTF2-like N-terminal transpeptidase domain